MIYGYARVSTRQQETHLQLDALRAAGVLKIYHEKSSAVGQRQQLHALLAMLAPGDSLTVWKIDRVARSLRDLLHILDLVKSKGATFRSLTEPIDTTTPMGTFVMQVLGAVAQLERSIIIQRTTAGIQAARSRGVAWGRRPILDPVSISEILSLVDDGFPISDVANAYGISRPLVYKMMHDCNKKPTV